MKIIDLVELLREFLEKSNDETAKRHAKGLLLKLLKL